MRTLAITANLVLLALVGALVTRGEFELEASELPLFLAMGIAPLLSIVALGLRGVAANDWLSRLFERRALVERRKLEKLRAAHASPAPAAPTDPKATAGRPPEADP